MSATSNTAPDQPKIGRAVLTPAIAARLEELRTCEELSKTKTVISSKPFALLIAQLAYEGNGGPERAYRFERLGKSR
jgi:hypothetical protein